MSEADFERAADEVTRLKVRPGYPELAEVYSLYKQATVGDVNIQRPGMFDIPGKAKWDAWKEKEGMAKEDAVTAYIVVVEQLKAKYGL